MGWNVIGFGNIEIDEKHKKEILDLMIGDDKKRVADKLKGETPYCHFQDVKGYNREIAFEMNGNKGIVYDELDRIKEYCKKNKIDIIISVSEYIESTDGGYYYDSCDEDE